MKSILQGTLIAVLLICLLLPVLACDDTEEQQPEPIIDENGKTGTESAVAYKDSGLAAMSKGESGTARRAFDKAISLDPNLAEAYCYRAINDMESGAPYTGGTTWARVFADCNKAIELKTDYAKAYDARGFYYVKMGQFELAVSDYSKSIELDPGDALVYYHRGFAYYQRKQWDRALPDFSKSIELDPKAIHCQYYRGTIYALREEWDLAIDDLSKVAARASIAWTEPRQELAQAYYQRGIIYIGKGDRDRAIADLNKVIELSADVDLKAQAKQKLQEMGIK
jgi:tetratricopeptide (TPR) repeat protein